MKARFWLAQKEDIFDHGPDPLTRPAPLGLVALVLAMVLFWAAVVVAIRALVF